MTIMYYEWEDTSDRHATGVPDLSRHHSARATTKAAVRREWREYLEAFPQLKGKAKIRVWRISYEEVTVW